jgi:hypothetical protein
MDFPIFGQHLSPTKPSNLGLRRDSTTMKKYIYLVPALALFVACEQKQTTVNPPAEKKESNTTVINPSPATETKKEKTEININPSPRPQ